jgi:hypothetical protein
MTIDELVGTVEGVTAAAESRERRLDRLEH